MPHGSVKNIYIYKFILQVYMFEYYKMEWKEKLKLLIDLKVIVVNLTNIF